MSRCVECGRSKEQHAPETLVCPDGRTVYTTMDLPPDTTCSDCRHFPFCFQFIGPEIADHTSCDWFPIRFVRCPLSAVRSPASPQDPDPGTQGGPS